MFRILIVDVSSIFQFGSRFSVSVDKELRDFFAIAATRLWMALVLAAIIQ